MAIPKRKGVPKKEKDTKNKVGLFDFLDDITYTKKNILNSENYHLYSRYMICKFLSMNENYLGVVDHVLNKYQGCLDNYQFHKLCIGLIPQKKIYFQYNIAKPDKNNAKEQVKYISEYFKVSDDQAYEYYEIGGEQLVNNIKTMYGIAPI
jgi:hypothetical protein